MRTQPILALTVVGLLVFPAMLASVGAGGVSHERFYLLASDEDYLYWSVDPNDPELQVEHVSRTCGMPTAIPRQSDICAGFKTLWFSPATILDGPVSWGPDAPLRFHVALDVLSPTPVEVSFVVASDNELWGSTPVEASAPNIYEGEITEPGSLSGTTHILGFRVLTTSSYANLEFQAGGASWLELPEPVPARGVPTLLAEDPAGTAPSVYDTAGMKMWFRDDAYTTHAFPPNPGQGASLEYQLTEAAPMLFAWVHGFHTPLVHDVSSGEQADTRKVTGSLALEVLHNGSVIAGHDSAPLGQGQELATALHVPPGHLELRVNVGGDEPIPYEVHLVAVHGETTVDRFRWTANHDLDARTPSAAVCRGPPVPIPVTERVTTFAIDLDWDTYALGAPKWTLAYEHPGSGFVPCGEEGMGDEIRITIPHEWISWVRPVNAQDSLHASVHDTVFATQVEYAYAP